MPSDLREKLQASLGGEYTIERELGGGGMSRVFVATECALGRQVVVKVLSSDVAASLDAERFKREIVLAARLQHPNVVPLLATGQAGPWLYYTMPLVDGESLRERIDRERPMAIPDILRVLSEVASALDYAHEKGVAHRDIKPENVMFYHGQAVVLDFGIGKALTVAVLEDGVYPKYKTIARKALGTPKYMAPEQAAADPALDHRADLYAFGVVAYEMITGHPPFAARSVQELIAAHRQQAPEPVAQRRPDVPPRLAALVMRCLEKEPADRPQSGRAIASELGEIGGNPPTRALPGWLPWAISGVMTVLVVVLVLLLLRAR